MAADVAISPEPFVITDFTTGSGGDVIDYGDLLRNASTTYDGSNPFSKGLHARAKRQRHALVLFKTSVLVHLTGSIVSMTSMLLSSMMGVVRISLTITTPTPVQELVVKFSPAPAAQLIDGFGGKNHQRPITDDDALINSSGQNH